MNQANETNVLPRRLSGWERFWFTPMDPTLIGLIRLFTGIIALYTIAVYALSLQDMMGEDAWYDLKLRNRVIRDRATLASPLMSSGAREPIFPDFNSPDPREQEKADYFKQYKAETNFFPLPPYPRTPQEAAYTIAYHKKYSGDLRSFGLRPPANEKEQKYLETYTDAYKQPPPAYPETEEEENFIKGYMDREGPDPRHVYARGLPVWSIWFDITDPFWMNVVHWGFVFIFLLFTIGFCTRVTSVLTFVAGLCYIHRNPAIQFGADTMINILMLYLVIGPSGAAISVDRLLARWWQTARPRVLARWFKLWGKDVRPADIAPGSYNPRPEPLVSANVAIRLLQIHLCIIYLISGLSKLQGAAWWNGQAIWGTIANFEFAPMQIAFYNDMLRFLGRHPALYETFLTGAAMFTLAFEISYVFLIWRPSLRWVLLSAAFLLHGCIGMMMGLKTFSLIMLVMNMAFLYPEEARRLLALFFGSKTPEAPAAPPAKPALAAATGIKK